MRRPCPCFRESDTPSFLHWSGRDAGCVARPLQHVERTDVTVGQPYVRPGRCLATERLPSPGEGRCSARTPRSHAVASADSAGGRPWPPAKTCSSAVPALKPATASLTPWIGKSGSVSPALIHTDWFSTSAATAGLSPASARPGTYHAGLCRTPARWKDSSVPSPQLTTAT